MIKAFEQDDVDKSLRYLHVVNNVLSTWNWIYCDNEIEDLLARMSAKCCIDANPTEDPNKRRIVFCDQFGGSFILALQYLRCFIKEGYEILYILCDDSGRFKNMTIIPELESYGNVKVLHIGNEYNIIEKAQQIYKEICVFNPDKLFVHTKSFSSFNLVLPQIKCTKYYIDLGDHAFWVGARHVDYVLPYRQFGAVIDKEKRGFREEQILLMPYYPITDKKEFAGFPKEADGKVVIFTGGDFYKTIDGKNSYWNLIKHILEQNPSAVILGAVKCQTDDTEVFLQRFISENNLYGRFIPIGFRSDINEVFEHCDIYLATCPMSGGLMTQYAAINAKPILQFLTPDMEDNNETEQVICFNDSFPISFTCEKSFLLEAKRLIGDVDYRKKQGKRLYDALIKKEQFDDLLIKTITSNKTQLPIQPYTIHYDNITNWWMEIEKRGFSGLVPYLYGILKQERLLYLVPKMVVDHYVQSLRKRIHPRRWLRLTREWFQRLFFVLDFYLVPDSVALRRQYKKVFGKRLNLDNPQSFNEKIQWLKLHDRKPEYKLMTDKVESKKYVASIIGDEYIIPTLGVWHSFDEIDWDSLPNQFVLKCNHDASSTIIVRDKSKLDKDVARKKLTIALKDDYYMYGRQWSYKGIERRILAEKFMSEEGVDDIIDYKFFCFGGIPRILFVATDRNSKNVEVKFDFFDMDFEHLPFTNGHPHATTAIKKPVCFEKMKELASTLSRNFAHIRVDFYEINGKVYFGEITFYHNGGMVPILPEEWDYKMGSWIDLTPLQ